MVETKQCPHCGEIVPITDIQKRHMNTAYVEEELNYMESCTPCFNRSEENWTGMWADYYSGCI